jgi:membrane protein
MSVAQPISAQLLPVALDTSAARYGSIGVAFTYLTWLYIVSWALLACSVLGQVMVTDEGAFGRFLRGKRTPDTPVPVPVTDDDE